MEEPFSKIMRILFLANNDGGLYKFRKELIKKLSSEHKVFFCLPKGEYIKDLIDLGGTYIPCKLECHGVNPLKEAKLICYYRKILKMYYPDIVFTYTIKPNIYGGLVCAEKNIPYVANITGLGTAVENKRVLQKIVLFLYKCSLRKASKVFFQNTDNRNFMLKRKIVCDNYDLLPGSGVNLEQYHSLDYPKKDIIHFVFVARIIKEKGIDQYLQAAILITKRYQNTRFHLCGSTNDKKYLEKIKVLEQKGIVIYHGAVKDMIDIYKNSHCTIHPTYYPEGISNVLLESCACARPIITTDRSGCREVVEDGVNGFVVKQKDSKDLIRVIEKFLALSWEEKRTMGLAGRKKVEKEFDRNIVVEKYMEEIKKLK